MEKALYSNDYSRYIPCTVANAFQLEIKVESVSVRLLGWKSTLYWNIATLGKAKVYVVYDRGQAVHHSVVVRGKEKFSFLEKNDIEIGPCWTHPEYRGLGIYPAVLSTIIQKELSEGGVAYMIIAESNQPSQNGVAKVGFEKTGDYIEKDKWRRYYIKR